MNITSNYVLQSPKGPRTVTLPIISCGTLSMFLSVSCLLSVSFRGRNYIIYNIIWSSLIKVVKLNTTFQLRS